ncbi:hypothetical protein [Salipaludibacillus aurantiacus]|uniref:Uncharacterized protein n=1 Tax=Salipaludibacillus aurantiacus TaxID=1601833 RepID=A0A1H9U0S3_9BACI|nr:hypothetical protein [Salipaludibacillus aurantiacus]SES02868.1 hypothetical protein SAMN05518684_106211 [Salipaludibacillus aurantiacus]
MEETKVMKEMLDIQGSDGNWNYNEYMHGMYNGMEYMLAMTEGREPVFRSAPETWIKDKTFTDGPKSHDMT